MVVLLGFSWDDDPHFLFLLLGLEKSRYFELVLVNERKFVLRFHILRVFGSSRGNNSLLIAFPIVVHKCLGPLDCRDASGEVVFFGEEVSLGDVERDECGGVEDGVEVLFYLAV